MLGKMIRKSLFFLLAYLVVMVGIFVIQFRNDSVISENFGNLHLILYEADKDEKNQTLQNKMTITYNGITFSASNENPVTINRQKSIVPISLVSWKKQSPLSFILNFTDDVEVRIVLSDDSSTASLNLSANLPFGVEFIKIPYSLALSSEVKNLEASSIQVTNKRHSFNFNATKINSDSITISRKDAVASYSYIDKNKSFSFELAKNSEFSSDATYTAVLDDYKKRLISTFEQNLNANTAFEEQDAVSYIAAMAEKGKYNEALEKIPQNFKRGTVKSYFSSPYFDNLTVTSEALFSQLAICAEKVSKASSADVLSALNEKNLNDYMRLHPASTSVTQFLSTISAFKSDSLTISSATKILSLYVELKEKEKSLATILEPVLSECTKKIENTCTADSEKITVSENGILLSVVNAVAVGDALYQYGKISGNLDIQKTGSLIIYSYLCDNASFDLKTLSEIYPLVVHDNKYYPHMDILAFENGHAVWAWTCAQKVTYKNDGVGTVTLTVDFPISYTHYLILSEIPSFKTIFIYNMIFRTDYRFETYNSSGYVYQADTRTLLLKSRHREKVETITMTKNAITQDENAQDEQETKNENN